MQPEVSSSPLTLVFTQQIPHEEKQRRKRSSTGGCNKDTECPVVSHSMQCLPLCVIALLSSPPDPSPSPSLPCHSEGGGLL